MKADLKSKRMKKLTEGFGKFSFHVNVKGKIPFCIIAENQSQFINYENILGLSVSNDNEADDDIIALAIFKVASKTIL